MPNAQVCTSVHKSSTWTLEKFFKWSRGVYGCKSFEWNGLELAVVVWNPKEEVWNEQNFCYRSLESAAIWNQSSLESKQIAPADMKNKKISKPLIKW